MRSCGLSRARSPVASRPTNGSAGSQPFSTHQVANRLATESSPIFVSVFVSAARSANNRFASFEVNETSLRSCGFVWSDEIGRMLGGWQRASMPRRMAREDLWRVLVAARERLLCEHARPVQAALRRMQPKPQRLAPPTDGNPKPWGDRSRASCSMVSRAETA